MWEIRPRDLKQKDNKHLSNGDEGDNAFGT